MSRPLLRGVSGGGRIIENSRDSWDSQMKDRNEKEDGDRNISPRGFPSSPLRFLASFLFHYSHSSKINSSENGFGSDPTNSSAFRSRQNITLQLLRFSLVLILILAISGSFLWTISISTSSRGNIFRGYRRLQEQLITDLTDIGVLSHGLAKLKDVEYCPDELENHVPCFNISENLVLDSHDGNEDERHCHYGSTDHCLVLPPKNYRIPLRWPTGRDIIWIANVRITAQEVLSSGSLTKRLMMLEEDQISFRSDTLIVEGVEDYSHQIAAMIGLRNEANFLQAGIRTVLDIGCGYGSFGAHLFSKQLLTMCVASYEESGSQVQFTLERGLPAVIGSFKSKQLPYPSLSFDMLHCAQCGIEWEQKDGIYLVEADRILKPGGYFVWTLSLTNTQKKSLHGNEKQEKWTLVRNFAENLCWDFIGQQDETIVWRKTSKRDCFASRKSGAGLSICSKSHDVETPYYRPLDLCIGGTRSRRWIPIEKRTTWPSRANLNATELDIHGINSEEFAEDALNWKSMVRNYWSLLSPLIFSDHPKRPGDEDPAPPYNMLRNVLDMNAKFGSFNAALLDAGKSVWVMNVVPTSGPNYLPLILDRGFVGVLHDCYPLFSGFSFNLYGAAKTIAVPNIPIVLLVACNQNGGKNSKCEAFPTYPRTYDMVHAEGLLSLEIGQRHTCTMFDIFLEMDRVLRPEGWVILRDASHLIQTARALVTQLRWEARVMELESNSDERLLVCQKPFIKKP